VGNTLNELPHLDIVDGVVLLENGKIEVGLELFLPSLLFASESRLESLWGGLRGLLQLALPLGSRARFYMEVTYDRGERLREYKAGIRSPHMVPKGIAEARADFLERERAKGRLFSWRTFLTVDMAVRKPGQMSFTPTELQEVLEEGQRLRARIEGFLSTAGFQAKAMDTQEVFDLLWRYLNPSLASSFPPQYRSLVETHTPVIPGKAAVQIAEWHQMTARAQAAGSIIENHSDRFIVVGGHIIDAVALYSPPDETFIGMLGRMLSNLPNTMLYLVVEYKHNPVEPIITKLQSDARKYMALAEGEGMRDFTAKGKLKEVEKTMDALIESGDHVYDTSVSILFGAPDVHNLAILRERVISATSVFPGSRPTYGGGLPFRLFFRLAPFNGMMSPHTFMVPTTNAADIAPTSTPWRGMPHPTAIYRNRYQSLTGINAFDPRATNWNGLVVAGSGSGKTFFAQSYLSSLLAQEQTEVIIVDRGGGYIPLVESIAGREVIIPIEPGTVSINAFDLPPGTVEPSQTKLAFVFAILRSMVPPSDNPEQAAIEDAILMAAIEQTYKRMTEEVRDPITGEYHKVFRGAQLSDLVQVLLRLDDIGGRAATERDKAVAKGLATRFQVWTGDTPYGSFVDRPTNIRTDYPIIYFETTGLDRYPDLQGPGLLLLADIIWRRAEKDPGIRKLVVMDEVWAMLKIPQAQNLIVELYRRARRYNTAIYSVSQSIMDFAEVRGIVQNTTYFFLGILPAEEHDAVQRLLGVPDSVKEGLKSLTMVKGKYSEFVAYVLLEGQPEGEIIRVEPSPLEYWLYTTNPSDMARRRQVMEERGVSIYEAAMVLSGQGV